MSRYFAHGKLLLTAEYFVLDGAPAVAAPTRFGQWLEVGRTDDPHTLLWQSLDHKGEPWFSANWAWQADALAPLQPSNETADRLQLLFAEALRQNPQCLHLLKGAAVTTGLEFPRHWGLGTSSTLVSNLGRWLQADPWALLAAAFGGSGYDLACADAPGPILYQLRNAQPQTIHLAWRPSYAHHLFFIYLGAKQNSREGIARYRALTGARNAALGRIAELSLALLAAQTPEAAAEVLAEHEAVVGRALGLTPLGHDRFADFPGQMKSLGAWGGDFALALARTPDHEAVARYFTRHGLNELLGYDEMML
jgi:mevalonate kinase